MQNVTQGHGGDPINGTGSEMMQSRRFGRMFPTFDNNQAMVLKLSTCARIGARMTAMPEESRKDSNLPAGYTYFGQFVDHDMSFDATQDRNDQLTPVAPGMLRQGRSSHLDLDSIYTEREDLNASLFDGPRFKIGNTTALTNADTQILRRSLPYDLPRVKREGESRPARQALIGDPRNDENLAVAQTHLMWLKFHNHIADALAEKEPTISDELLFARARDLVVRHYQHVILHDFLPQFINPKIYEDVVVKRKRRFLRAAAGEIPFMPLEFSTAAYRHGHSQVRESYSWNVEFPESSMRLLFAFSEVSGGSNPFFGLPTLPTNWIADFRRLYDFNGVTFDQIDATNAPPLNFAKALGPYISSVLGDLPELADNPAVPFTNLASLNLRKGSLRGMMAGQDLTNSISTLKTLSEADMRRVLDDAFAASMQQLGLFERTPLWLYVLLEAAVAGGNHLGELGSLIVAETFLTMVMTSRVSVIHNDGDWSPIDAQEALGAPAPLNTIPDILLWMDVRDPIIDPLRDVRTQET